MQPFGAAAEMQHTIEGLLISSLHHADADTRSCYSDVPPRTAGLDAPAQRSADMQRALDALALAAPVRGEVQPWVWLLRAVADTHQLHSVHCCICYLVRHCDRFRIMQRAHMRPSRFMNRQTFCRGLRRSKLLCPMRCHQFLGVRKFRHTFCDIIEGYQLMSNGMLHWFAGKDCEEYCGRGRMAAAAGARAGARHRAPTR